MLYLLHEHDRSRQRRAHLHVSALTDGALLAQTRKFAHLEHHLEVTVIDHLHEIHARRLHLRRGFSSLFDYAVRELGYSDSAASRRISAMKLCEELPEVRDGLQTDRSL